MKSDAGHILNLGMEFVHKQRLNAWKHLLKPMQLSPDSILNYRWKLRLDSLFVETNRQPPLKIFGPSIISISAL